MTSRGEAHLVRGQTQRFGDGTDHTLKLVPAPHDEAGCRDHAVGALAAREARALFDAIDRNLCGTAENRKHRPVLEKVDGIITPFTRGHFAAVEAENAVEFAPVQRYSDRGGSGGSPAPL